MFVTALQGQIALSNLYCRDCGKVTVFGFTDGAWVCRNRLYSASGNVLPCGKRHPSAAPPAPLPAIPPAPALYAAVPIGQEVNLGGATQATPNSRKRPATPPGILSDLGRRALTADFAIVAEDGTKVECHKAILGMRSTVFAAMMNWKEGGQGEVTLDQPAEVVEALVEFLYTDRIRLDKGIALLERLMALAEMYDLAKLKHLTESKILAAVTADSALHYLAFGSAHRSEWIKEKAVYAIAKDMGRVMHSEEWATFKKANPTLGYEVLDVIANCFNLVPKANSQIA